MLKHLKSKFVLTNMLLVGFILLAVAVTVCVYTYASNNAALDRSLEMGLELDDPAGPGGRRTEIGGRRPPEDRPAQQNTAVCTVLYDPVKGTKTTLSREAYLSEEILDEAVRLAAESDGADGYLKEYDLRFKKTADKGGSLRISFADGSYVKTETLRVALIAFFCVAGVMLVMFFVSLFLAGMALRPVEEAWEAQKRFVADASHELKTPLTVILANDRILRSHADETVESQTSWLESTAEEARRMRALVDDMLTLAQNEEGGVPPARERVDLSRLLNGTLLQLEPVAFEKGVALDAEIEDGLSLFGEEYKLKQLAVILVDNAVKYAPRGERVSVCAEKSGGKIRFSVKNTGSLIAPEDLPHVFERFYRADRSRSSEGAGLGLSIAAGIAERHGGRISAASDEKTGTVFTVILPENG